MNKLLFKENKQVAQEARERAVTMVSLRKQRPKAQCDIISQPPE